MNEDNVKKDSARAWLLAARPKTLTGCAVPVMIALALAWADINGADSFKPIPALLCLLFAFVMQIDANFVNDYFDFLRGNDDETRLGPKRACAMGWVSIERMRLALLLTTVLACIIGLPLVLYGGWNMIVVGVLCVLFCFLYTTKLSYLGLGDLLVLVFFGVVPVCVTYYIQRHCITSEVVIAALSTGLVVDTLLMVNNYRDIENDRRAGKKTLAVFMGAQWSRRFYLLLGAFAFVMGACFAFNYHVWAFLLPIVYLLLHVKTYRRMVAIDHGRALNSILGETSRNIFIYGLLVSIGFLI